MKSERRCQTTSRNRIIGIILLILSVFGFLIIAHRLSYYVYEYDPQYSPIDYGKYNILSYFTVQSNFFAYVYFLLAGLGMLGVKKAQKAGFSADIGVLVTTYIVIAGITYCAGIPMGLTPPSKWDTPAHAMSSFIQVYYHMIMPVVAVILWIFPVSGKKIKGKTIVLSGIYPLVYSLFSIIRGTVSDPTYYPYPFYNPEFIWQTFAKDKPLNLVGAYAIIAILLVFGIALFIGITALFACIHNKRAEKTNPDLTF